MRHGDGENVGVNTRDSALSARCFLHGVRQLGSIDRRDIAEIARGRDLGRGGRFLVTVRFALLWHFIDRGREGSDLVCLCVGRF